jgi:hypothetical protein
MKNIILKAGLLFSFVLGFFTGCANDDNYQTPENTLVTYELTPTRTLASVNSAATPTPVQFTTDDIIEAYVTSSDAQGTFYKSISFQTIPTDGSNPIGFSVPLNVTTLYGKGFTPGRKVYIKLNGLYSAIVYGSMQIGSLYDNGTPTNTTDDVVGRISEFKWQDHLFPSATIEPESAMVRTMSLATAYYDVNQNTLVDLDNVQFAEASINRTYYDIDSGGGATNHELISSAGGSSEIIRFSSFCPFTGKQVPTGSGKIRGVLTKYDTDFQFIVRYESDIELELPRFDVSPPVVGTAITYDSLLNEPFTSYSTNALVFPKYINDAVTGSRYWQVKTFGGNKYIQMSSYGGTPEANRVLFFVPVNLTAANTFSFKTKAGYGDSSVLKVYYSTNYVLGSDATTATLLDITSSFTYSPGSSSGYPTNFTNSGNYTIPAGLTGNGFFVFEYVGNGTSGPTTTMQIDDIVIN